jgi:hypothetical protein
VWLEQLEPGGSISLATVTGMFPHRTAGFHLKHPAGFHDAAISAGNLRSAARSAKAAPSPRTARARVPGSKRGMGAGKIVRQIRSQQTSGDEQGISSDHEPACVDAAHDRGMNGMNSNCGKPSLIMTPPISCIPACVTDTAGRGRSSRTSQTRTRSSRVFRVQNCAVPAV